MSFAKFAVPVMTGANTNKGEEMPQQEMNVVETAGTSIGKLLLGGLVLAGAVVITFGFGIPYMRKNKGQEYTTVEGPETDADTNVGNVN